MKQYHKVIVETSEKDRPYDFEISAAILVAEYFKTDIVFLRPTPLKSPDLKIDNQIWELKSPMGNGKNTIHNIFVTARHQSYNIVIDLRRCKMNENKAFSRIRDSFNKRRRAKCQLKIIRKNGKIVDISEIL
ncbi:hypothetical protein IKG24_00155 [Candidatus Saccharibacteria bacterium]|nr:hypothetical protein [Candidatus Saccharibacteria bacterium]